VEIHVCRITGCEDDADWRSWLILVHADTHTSSTTTTTTTTENAILKKNNPYDLFYNIYFLNNFSDFKETFTVARGRNNMIRDV